MLKEKVGKSAGRGVIAAPSCFLGEAAMKQTETNAIRLAGQNLSIEGSGLSNGRDGHSHAGDSNG
jgi:hypothetical protein